METELAIVGAGPAGLAAAVAAAAVGCQVTVIDAYARPGGQYYKQTPLEFHACRPQALHHDFLQAQQLLAQVEGNAHVRMLSNATVWTAQIEREQERPQLLQVQTPQGNLEVRAAKLILAPGAYDRVLPFPGWDLPGVMTVGAAQTLSKSQRVLPSKRIVLSGAGPFLWPVAAGLVQAGATVVGVFEATTPLQWSPGALRIWRHLEKLREGNDYLKVLRRHRVPLKFGRAVIAAEGHERVERVTVARLNADWTPLEGGREQLEADTLCIGYGFLPSLELSLLLGCAHDYDPVQATFVVRHDANMQSSQPGVFVAGEITGIGGSAVALAQGRLAGMGVAYQLGYVSEREAREQMTLQRRAMCHEQHFASIMQQLFALHPGWRSWPQADTIVCRCEEVRLQQIEEAIRDFGAGDVKTVKSLTRCGMGLCQGRVCGHIVTALTSAATGRDPANVGALSSRPIVKPVMLGAVCEEAPTV
jgi:NADPH-dependent 2,4-dienoyl-CoA reductase/sulfur reductase-like enzyme/bacterioferritin-associated ferredoxin